MRFDILTLFPEMFAPLQTSILKRAQQEKLISITTHNIRDFSADKHRRVDDTPYGGGAGMVMTCQPLFDCLKTVGEQRKKRKQKIIFLTPHGKVFTQRMAERLRKQDRLILLCGHYEGIDQRIRDTLIDEEISMGKYVLTGGELPAMVLVDCVARLVPGVLGREESLAEESFSKALKGKREYPHYTKPAMFRGMKVPEVLLSGNHKKIEQWRKEQCR
jgi:tRNA (guanine37-N1)-methyltransferase